MNKIKPLGNYIVVTQEKSSETLVDGGVVVAADISKTKPLWGYVLSIGDHVATVKVGDRVLFEQYAGKAFKFDGETLLLMSVNSLYGILDADTKVAVV